MTFIHLGSTHLISKVGKNNISKDKKKYAKLLRLIYQLEK
jgi:hypothetical protein